MCQCRETAPTGCLVGIIKGTRGQRAASLRCRPSPCLINFFLFFHVINRVENWEKHTTAQTVDQIMDHLLLRLRDIAVLDTQHYEVAGAAAGFLL